MASVHRRPVRNFFIMPELQIKYIVRVMALVNFTAVTMVVAICAFWYLGLPRDHSADDAHALFEADFWRIILPAFVLSEFISLILGAALSFYFSRRFAVPVYRIRKWAEAVAAGDWRAELVFRKGDEFASLSQACQEVAKAYRSIIAGTGAPGRDPGGEPEGKAP